MLVGDGRKLAVGLRRGGKTFFFFVTDGPDKKAGAFVSGETFLILAVK